MNTTIRLSKTTKEKLDKIKPEQETYDQFFKKLIEGLGSVEDIPTLKREQVAFSLESYYYGGSSGKEHIYGRRSMKVTFEDLRYSKIGDVFMPETSNAIMEVVETAEVIYKDKNNVLVKILIEGDTPEGHVHEEDMLNIYLP